ncbi:hypothetical protein C5748_27010 [Phyllobacterium phragmitis]|uniref:Uncharacterized protein n=1 Tax=Phyllobacterium phragmitis TaxID=2670329 RepID=A0A2S9IIT6_9HYPH|nr:hypothetical protein [Phyllobacterium phragmitis]PRD40429.1 hypothetical protein C5748_27010 [Phyllobacterium phragmitis]
MNQSLDSIAAASLATVDLEEALNDLATMANIAAQLIERALGDGSHEDITGHPDKYFLTSQELNRIVWSAYKTDQMACNLLKAFNGRALA